MSWYAARTSLIAASAWMRSFGLPGDSHRIDELHWKARDVVMALRIQLERMSSEVPFPACASTRNTYGINSTERMRRAMPTTRSSCTRVR